MLLFYYTREGKNVAGLQHAFWGPEAWFTYFTLVAWIGFVVVWLYRMNEALGLYDPIFIVPLLQVDFILFATVGAARNAPLGRFGTTA